MDVVRVRRVFLALLSGALVAAGCGGDGSKEHVPVSVQRSLPTQGYTLGSDLCPDVGGRRGAEARRTQRTAKRQLAALTQAYRRDPDALLTATFYSSDEGPAFERRRDVTVRELLEGHLEGVEPIDEADPAATSRCALRVRRRLARLLQEH